MQEASELDFVGATQHRKALAGGRLERSRCRKEHNGWAEARPYLAMPIKMSDGTFAVLWVLNLDGSTKRDA